MCQWGQFSDEIFNRIQSGIILIDIEGNIAQFNQYTSELLQIKEEAWVNRSITELFPELDMGFLQQAVSEKNTITVEELRLQVNGNEFALRTEISPLISLGQTVGTVLTLLDQTATSKLRDDILYAEKMAAIGNMAAGTVHEVRNPLTTIKGFLQLFERDITKLSGMGLVQRNFSDKCANVFPLLFVEIGKIEQILNDFLLISQPQAIRYKVLRINDFVNQALPKLQELAIHHDVSIVCEFPKKNSKFFGDPEELKSVLINLVRNSLESFEGHITGGKIHLLVETMDDSIRLNVQDNGKGMTEELAKMSFDPFVTTKPDHPGLGLSICQQVIVRMGGTIFLSSEVGKGTTVEFVIPCLQDDIVSLEVLRPVLKEVTYR